MAHWIEYRPASREYLEAFCIKNGLTVRLCEATSHVPSYTATLVDKEGNQVYACDPTLLPSAATNVLVKGFGYTREETLTRLVIAMTNRTLLKQSPGDQTKGPKTFTIITEKPVCFFPVVSTAVSVENKIYVMYKA